MKKLLSLLSSTVIAASASLAVVSCSVPTTKISFSFVGADDKGNYKIKSDANNDYSLSDIEALMLGNATGGHEIGSMNFDDLNLGLLQLLNFNQSMVVKTQNNYGDLARYRNLWLGRDKENNIDTDAKESPAGVPSVDGIKFEGVDSKDSKDYYANFKNTSVNSLKGLYDLANYDGALPSPSNNVNLAKERDMAKDVFNKDKDGNDSDGNKLISDLIGSEKNPAFTKINYGFNVSDMVEYNPKSTLIMPFSDDDNINSIKPGAAQAYKDLNNNVGDPKDKDGNLESGKKINERKDIDPFYALLLPTVDKTTSIETGAINVVNSTLSADDKKANKKQKILNGTISNSASPTLNGTMTTSDEGKNSFDFSSDNFITKDVVPFNVTYTYDTNVNAKSQATKDSKEYKISVKVNDLKAVFMPQVYTVNTLSPVSQATDEKGNTSITFNMNKGDYDSAVKDTDKNPKDSNAYTIVIDGDSDHPYTPTGKDSDTIVWNSTKPLDPGEHKVTVGDRTYNFRVEKDKKTSTSFNTQAVTWAFVGYKFFDQDAAVAQFKDSKDDPNAFTGVQDLIDPDNKQEPFVSEMEHNYKDILLSDLNIQEVKKDQTTK